MSVALPVSFVGCGFVVVGVVRKTEGRKWKGSPRNLHKWFANGHQMITSDFQTKIVLSKKYGINEPNSFEILYLKVLQRNKTRYIIWNLFFGIFFAIVRDSRDSGIRIRNFHLWLRMRMTKGAKLNWNQNKLRVENLRLGFTKSFQKIFRKFKIKTQDFLTSWTPFEKSSEVFSKFSQFQKLGYSNSCNFFISKEKNLINPSHFSVFVSNQLSEQNISSSDFRNPKSSE